MLPVLSRADDAGAASLFAELEPCVSDGADEVDEAAGASVDKPSITAAPNAGRERRQGFIYFSFERIEIETDGPNCREPESRQHRKPVRRFAAGERHFTYRIFPSETSTGRRPTQTCL